MKVLVTGGAGYIGSVLVPELLNSGHRVRVLDVIPPCAGDALVGDLSDRALQVAAVDGMDAVVHLAALVRFGEETGKEAQRMWAVNVNATGDLIATARRAGVTRFILLSTCSLYGVSEQPADEEHPVTPTSLYARSKLEAEGVVLKAVGPAFHPTVLRLATVFGGSPRLSFMPLLNMLVRDALTTGRLRLYGPQSARTFVHVKDAVRAIEAVLTAPVEHVSGEIFNVGAEHLTRTKSEVVALLQQILPDLTVDVVGEQDARSYRVSFRKIGGLGFRVKHGLAEGIREVVDLVRVGEAQARGGRIGLEGSSGYVGR